MATNHTIPPGARRADASMAETYRAWDTMPRAIRHRLMEAIGTISPVAVLRFYEGLVAKGKTPEEAERECIARIDLTDKMATDALDQERKTWSLGEDMKAGFQRATAKIRGNHKPAA